jgi:hypothetical protein
MSDYTLAVVRGGVDLDPREYRGVETVAYRHEVTGVWYIPQWPGYYSGPVEVVRPLVVLDFGGEDGIDVVDFLNSLRGGLGGDDACNIADQIERQVLQPLAEPLEFGTRVMARPRRADKVIPPRLWIRVLKTEAGDAAWHDGADGAALLRWSELRVTEVLG